MLLTQCSTMLGLFLTALGCVTSPSTYLWRDALSMGVETEALSTTAWRTTERGHALDAAHSSRLCRGRSVDAYHFHIIRGR